MLRRLLLASLCLLLASAVLPVRPSAGDDDAPGGALAGPHGLDDGITLAREELRTGSAKKALAAFKTLLAGHKDKDYAKARRQEIEELLLHLACGVEHKRPRVKDLLSGKLQSWSPEKGRIKITYTPSSIKDLDKHDGLVHLPARMSGPFTLEIKGSSYPRLEGKAPVIQFGGDQHPETGRVQNWRVEFGAPKPKGRTTKVTTEIIHSDGGKESTLVTKTGALSKPDKPYKVSLKSTKTKLTAVIGSRTAAYVKKGSDEWGYLSFRVDGWTQIKLTGTIETSWIESRLAEVFRGTLLEFEKGYDASEHVPEWLSDPLDRDESKPDRKPVDLVAALSPKEYDAYLEVDNDIRMEEWDRALAGIPKAAQAGLSEATCEWLRAQAYESQNQMDAALEHLTKVVTLEPEFLDAVLMRGSILRKLGRYDEALATFQRATGVYAQIPSAYAEAASAMLYAGRPEDAAALTRAAARNGVYSPQLLTLRDALQKVVNGPKWTKRFEQKSQNYHVISNIDRVICREASKLLEESFEAFRQKLGFVERDKTRLFKVYLFKTQEGFMGYMGQLSEFMGKPTDKAAGLYTPLLKQLLIWEQPRRSDMLETIRHEGFHQYLDRVMASPPVWFNEGMAVYHENGESVDGKMTFGHIQRRYVRLLSNRGLMPIKKFLTSGPGLFYEDGHRSYGQGWLLVHMMQHTTPEYRKRFQDLMDGLKSGNSFATVKRVLPDAILPQLEKDMRLYLEKLEKQ